MCDGREKIRGIGIWSFGGLGMYNIKLLLVTGATQSGGKGEGHWDLEIDFT